MGNTQLSFATLLANHNESKSQAKLSYTYRHLFDTHLLIKQAQNNLSTSSLNVIKSQLSKPLNDPNMPCKKFAQQTQQYSWAISLLKTMIGHGTNWDSS